MNARVIALDISPERLVRAKEFGAEEVLDPSQDDAVQAIRDLTRGEGAEKRLIAVPHRPLGLRACSA